MSGGAAHILVTGGAGFIGTNLTQHLVRSGMRVRIYDSLARAGSHGNIAWLQRQFPGRIEFVHGDVRDCALLGTALDGVDHVFHLAAQVAVTTSLVDPRADFEVNARGTLNLLEAARARPQPPSLVFSSTNKVYGVLPDVQLRRSATRYVPTADALSHHGIGESRCLDFHSPYGCSKGAADQYVLDYARSYGMRSVVLRMSCIYGPHQDGNEDQGWVAHFVRRVLAEQPITIYGDGLQVRDLLFVDDLVAAFECARCSIDALQGQAFNIGGGIENSASLVEVLKLIERHTGLRVRRNTGSWRVGDQRYYVSDISKFKAAVGWQPQIGVEQGLAALCDWFVAGAKDVASERRPASVAAAAIRP